MAFALACLLFFTTCSGSILAAQTEAADPLVNYLVVEEPVIETPGTQAVMLGIGDGSVRIDAATLFYRNQATGEIFEKEAAELADDFVLFQMEYYDESASGEYQLERITYTAEGTEHEAAFAEMGIDASFGVNQPVESEPDDVFLSDEDLEALAAETELSIVSLDEDGNAVSGESLEQALEDAGCVAYDEGMEYDEGMPVMLKGAAKSVEPVGMSSLIVVLDPGHGGSDPGAQKNGIVEKNVNLKIAQYCKAELEEYAGIIVYMTRTGDEYLSLAERAQVAVDKGANVFISLHNNSNTSSAPNGANVYYPNSNYNANCGATGQALASVIESKLTDLGLASGGIHIRNSENSTLYPDKSLADYYGVIKRCKENGIPGLIVEHAFISNASDAKNYLSTDEQLKRLGIADATGIAEYYGLNKGLGFNSIQSKSSTTMDLKWTPVVGVTGYCLYRSLSSGSGFKKVATISPATVTSWTDTGLEPDKVYYYKIRTYTKSNSKTKYGAYSSVASGVTMAKPVISSIKSKNSKELEISWSTVNNAANYEIYRATKKAGSYTQIATVAGINRVNYTDVKIKSGKQYYYKIRSIGQVDNTTVYSDYSDPVAARTATIPSNVSVKSQETNTLRISWTADKNVAGYIIKRAESANGKYKKIATVKGGSENYYDDGTVKAKKTYYYMIQSYNLNNKVKGYSGYGKPASGKTIGKASITKIISTSSTKQTISWKKAGGVDGYVIYQSTSKNGKYKKIKTIASAKTTSYKVKGLKAGTHYYYKVRTKKNVNKKTEYGSYSAARDAWAGKKAQITSVQGISGTKATVFWNPVSGAEQYDVYRAESENGTYKKIASVKDTAVSYTDKNLKMTSQYFYKVEARMKGYKATGTSGMSKAVGGYPICVTNISSVAENASGMLEVRWMPVSDVTGYRIYRSTAASGAYALISTVSGSQSASYADTSAVRGVTYYYKVVLVGQYGQETVYGQESSAVSGMLPVLEDPAPDPPLQTQANVPEQASAIL